MAAGHGEGKPAERTRSHLVIPPALSLQDPERAKLDPKKLTPHTLRHTGISLVLMGGADLRTAQTISGHKTVAMLMHYAHVFTPHVRSAMGVLNRGISDTITPELHTVLEEAPEQPDNVRQLSAGKQ